MAKYDWLSNDDGEEARYLRAGDGPVGVHPYGTPGEGGARMWTWGCRCGAWLDTGEIRTRADAREQYRAHKTTCPLKMGLVWNQKLQRWTDPSEED